MKDFGCAICGYFWKEDYEERPSCHWVSRCPDDFPPCEEEEYENPDCDPEWA